MQMVTHQTPRRRRDIHFSRNCLDGSSRKVCKAILAIELRLRFNRTIAHALYFQSRQEANKESQYDTIFTSRQILPEREQSRHTRDLGYRR